MNLDPLLPSAHRDKQEIGQRKELTKLGSVRKQKGLRIYCWHNGNVTEVKPETADAELKPNGEVAVQHNVTTIPGAKYLQSPNLENAIRKFAKKGFTINA